MSRFEQLQEMLRREPDDVFLRYALAMELRSLDRLDESIVAFRALMDETHHVPAFFMGAQALAEAGRIPEAREVLREGIDQARRQGDQHAAAEMSEFLMSLGALGE